MSAAYKIPDVNRAFSRTADADTDAGKLVLDVMRMAAATDSMPMLEQVMRRYGRDLVDAITNLTAFADERPDRVPSLEARLQERGVRQNILDNLEIANLHARRGQILFAHFRNQVELDELTDEPQERLRKLGLAQWEYVFGRTFLSLVAAGLISESEPGVDQLLGWMRQSSRDIYVHASALDEMLKSVA